MTTQSLDKQLQTIRALLCDVDGILTDGGLYYSDQGESQKRFHVHDGLGLQCLKHLGIRVGVISGRQSTALEQRLKDLGIQDVALKQHPKMAAFHDMLSKWQLEPKEVAFMGDDLNDLPLLEAVGVAITVPCAPSMVQAHCTWVTQKSGGEGAVREVCDRIISAQEGWAHVLSQLNQTATLTQ